MNKQLTSLRHMILDSYTRHRTEAICQIARYVWDIIICPYESYKVGDWALRLRKEFLNTPDNWCSSPYEQ